MIWRIVRRVFRLAGWLMTPMVIVAAAGAGAFLLALVAPKLSITAGLVLVGVAGLIGAIVGLLLWTKLLRQSPELRHALAVTPDGVPEGKAVEEMFELDRPASGGGST
jgi:predicted membrane-bound spermidine synthase